MQTTQIFSNENVGTAQKKSNKSNKNKSNNVIKWSIVCIVVVLVGVFGYLLYSNLGTNTINGHEYVDLGLPSGTKWATCNVGANSSEEYGDYYAWGEISTKSEYSGDNSLTYCRDMDDISGNVNYDAATANWGGSWRMPTEAKMEELLDECTWTLLTSQSGVNGYKVTGPNGNSIFLPAAGNREYSSLNYVGERGYYWTSTPIEFGGDASRSLYFYKSGIQMSLDKRNKMLTIRPVTE